MISANLLVGPAAAGSTLDSPVHREPRPVVASINRDGTRNTSIKARVYRPSSANIRQISVIGACENLGALEFRDTIAGAPTIPVSRNAGGGR